jgi:glyoxylase-like metal-dependent hydrolase (beta-lactamase superfamily II)
MADVEEVKVVVAHHERATLRVGNVFLKIDADQTRHDTVDELHTAARFRNCSCSEVHMAQGEIQVGSVRMLGVSDATVDYPWPLEELFPGVSTSAWEEYRASFPEVFANATTWRSSYTCYLLRAPGRTILVDTGMGPAGAPLAALFGFGGQLLDKLAGESVRPEDVDTVVLGHLHPDHVGWNVQPQDSGYRLTFPRARYVVHQADWDAFHTPEVQAHFPFPFVEQLITPLQQLGALELIAADHSVTPEIRLWHTPGHTPGHLSTLITSGSDRAVIWGDVAIHPAQVCEPELNVMFDMDGAVARQTRAAVLDRVEAEGMTVAARHFPEPGFGHVVRLEGRRYWQAVDVPPQV